MTRPPRQLKYSGMISPHDALHLPITPSTSAGPPDEQYLTQNTVNVTIVAPPNKVGPLTVPQYGTPVNGGIPTKGFNPAGDCEGSFMSCNYQANNNCYAYGCNYATNSFPQPGRYSGYDLSGVSFDLSVDALGEQVRSYAEKDGLRFVGKTMEELKGYKVKMEQVAMRPLDLPGHYVALMVSPAGTDSNWGGDYHWARCDNSNGACDSWSQKDGGDQVTNFDFAGNPITDPSTANWTVNQGPVEPAIGDLNPPKQGEDLVVEYVFYCYMYVPETGVNIL
jgi:hypothetical protein